MKEKNSRTQIQKEQDRKYQQDHPRTEEENERDKKYQQDHPRTIIVISFKIYWVGNVHITIVFII